MIKGFVVDSSIGFAWIHPAQATAQSQALLEAVNDGARAKAPALWTLETANALVVLVRRGKLTDAERLEALSALARLSVEFDHEASSLAFSKLFDLVSKHNLSVCDAAYLELALRSKLPLACKDGPLRKAAKRWRVPGASAAQQTSPCLQGRPSPKGREALPREGRIGREQIRIAPFFKRLPLGGRAGKQPGDGHRPRRGGPPLGLPRPGPCPSPA